MNIEKHSTQEIIEAGKLTNMLGKLLNSFDSFLQKLASIETITDDNTDVDSEKEESAKVSNNNDNSTNDEMKYEFEFSPKKLPFLVFHVVVTSSKGKRLIPGSSKRYLDITLSLDPDRSKANTSNKLKQALHFVGFSVDYAIQVASALSDGPITTKNLELDVDEGEETLGNIIIQTVIDMLKNYLGDDMSVIDEKSIRVAESASSSISFELQKVTCDTGYDINLVSVSSATDPITATSALQDLVSDDDFIDSLSVGDPVPYVVNYSDDCLDVEICEDYEINMVDCICNILRPTYTFYIYVNYVKWNAGGSQYDAIIRECDMLVWSLRDIISYFSKLARRLTGFAPHPLSLIDCGFSDYNTGVPEDYDELQINFSSQLNLIISTIELYYSNFNPEDQSRLNVFLEDLKTRLSYYQMNEIPEPTPLDLVDTTV